MKSGCDLVGNADEEEGEGEAMQWYCVGCYLTPHNKEKVAQLLLSCTMQTQKKERRLLILDNLNTDLDASRTTHDDILATKVAELERFSSHLSRHYASRTT